MAHAPSPAARHYGLDWLRIGAFALLILYHVGKFFAPGEWMVKAAQPVVWADWPMLAVQPWRMPLLFAVSGYATYALLGKAGGIGSLLRRRSARLLGPLAFGILVLNPPQFWASLVDQHGYQAGLAHFWMRDWLSFGSIGGMPLPHEGHLWFLAYLWTYTFLLLAAIACLPGRAAAAIAARFDRLGIGLRLLWGPLAVLMTIRLALLFTVPEEHGVLHDWVSDSLYVPAFLFGFGLAARPALWVAVRRCAAPAAIGALVCYALLVVLALWYPGDETKPHLEQAMDREAGLIMGWCAIIVLLAAADRWLNRDARWRARLGEAVFPFYLAHHTIIVLTGWRIKQAGVGNEAAFALLLAATLGGCWLFYEVGRRIGPLRPWIGLAPLPRQTEKLVPQPQPEAA